MLREGQAEASWWRSRHVGHVTASAFAVKPSCSAMLGQGGEPGGGKSWMRIGKCLCGGDGGVCRREAQMDSPNVPDGTDGRTSTLDNVVAPVC